MQTNSLTHSVLVVMSDGYVKPTLMITHKEKVVIG